LSDPSKNLLDQQRRLQEQQQKMWQEQQRRRQIYGYISQQQKDIREAKTRNLFSCSVCGSVSEVKYCFTCRRLFCKIHLPVKSFSNIQLPASKTGIIGHVCVLSRQRTDRSAEPPPPPGPPTEEHVEKVESDESVRTMNKWKCPICDHINPEETDICEECGVYSGERS
jgi:hypothetical protein